MKPTATILVCVLAVGLASAQSPSTIQNTRATLSGVSENATAASSPTLGDHQADPAAASVKRVRSQPASVKKNVKKPVAGVGIRPSAQAKPTVAAPASNPPAGTSQAGNGAAGSAEGEQPIAPDSKYSAKGKRDPFISPVVSRATGGSGCSTGKKCLEIGAINLKGVVRAENGFIAVVSNGMNKAYFLRENDPVFNGYVVKITGDSIVFQETLQDRLGKTFTREVVKKITTPAV